MEGSMRSYLIAVLVLAAATFGTDSDTPLPLKVGVTEYQNSGKAYQKYRQFFRDVELASGSKLRFFVAVGTYDEVLKWRDQGKIDVAVLSAAPVARVLSVGNSTDRKELTSTYLGHLIYFNAPRVDESTGKKKGWVLDLLPPDQQKPRLDGYYRTICVVRKNSGFTSLKQI